MSDFHKEVSKRIAPLAKAIAEVIVFSTNGESKERREEFVEIVVKCIRELVEAENERA